MQDVTMVVIIWLGALTQLAAPRHRRPHWRTRLVVSALFGAALFATFVAMLGGARLIVAIDAVTVIVLAAIGMLVTLGAAFGAMVALLRDTARRTLVQRPLA
ncbi:hypothetical protein QH494_25840 [Sphingomonas sp. AR_OL41]|jgi:hypothetical protein|uniref:hypothetical protein n=1 Tax=Sphingomonas sp. AR_OL41 TaxID=3042729 RepID=UPI00247FFE4A|nr:hypothetical protein [Sphingomonas sp. AR_OL41]MDH7975621.1 hypothetical protein [Sphingomonas sp. AR_OL41]